MKKQHFLIPLLLIGLISPSIGQENSAENLEEKAQNMITNPSMQNLFRRAKKDPEGAVESMKQNPSDLVREAQRAIEDKKSEIDTTGIDTPENRRKMEGLKAAAMSKIGEVTGDKEAAEKAPATRSAAGATRFVTPIAMPIEDTPTPIAEEANVGTIVPGKNRRATCQCCPDRSEHPRHPCPRER